MKAGSRAFRLAFAALFLFHGRASRGATSTPPHDLNKQLAQTIASLFSVTVRDYFVASRWNRPDTANVVEFQTLIPFKIWDQENLLRLNVPFRTESELGPGLSDVRLFDLLMFKTGFGSWGIGADFNLGIYRGPGIDSFQAGPAMTLLATAIPSLSIGLLNQNYFNDQFAISSLQPILVFHPGRRWTLSLGELPLIYDWRKGTFAIVSIGLQVGILVKIAQQPVRLFVNPQFNTESSSQLYHWTIASGVTLPLTPSGPRI